MLLPITNIETFPADAAMADPNVTSGREHRYTGRRPSYGWCE